jgi:hypothetical protein
MNNKALLSEIAKQINILELHIKRLKNKSGEVHEIDIDLMAEKLKDLYSMVIELETGKAIQEITEEEPIVEPEPDPVPSPQDLEPVPETEETPKAKTTADLFSGTTTIADSFQSQEDRSIAARVSPQSVDDLKMAIGINDKFLFINELFKGSPSDYNAAIDKLNSAPAMTEAETTIMEYRSQFDWSDNSEAYNRLKKIVQAKFN